MSFDKGKSGNPKGRPKGAKGKAPAALIDRVRLLIEANFEQLQADIEALPPTERVRAITRLMEYVLPKTAAVKMSGGVDTAPTKRLTMAEAKLFIQSLEASV